MSLGNGRLYGFGPFRLDTAERRLLQEGQPVPLTPKAFDTLVLLVENSGHLLEKSELMRKLWPDTFVEEFTLTRNIADVRKALGDGANGVRYIETVPKKGYRFVAEVRELPDQVVVPVAAGDRDSHLVQPQEGQEELRAGDVIKTVRAPSRRRFFAVAVIIAALVIASAVWWLLRPQSVREPEAMLTATPLTSYQGNEWQVSLSPDGNQAAFSWNGEKQDNYDIYLKLIGPGIPLRLTTSRERDSAPAWSPDGRWIAFYRVPAGGKAGLFLIPALGGSERKLLEISGSLYFWEHTITWHPDSAWLAFVDGDPPGGPTAVLAVSLSSGQKRRLTKPPASASDDSPAFSPDGRSLVFCRRTAFGQGELFLLPLSASLEPQGQPKQLTFDTRDAYTPAWTADGREIVYSVGPVGNFTLWRIRVPSSGGSPKKAERLSVGQDGVAPALSRQGHRLVYTRSWRDLNIWRLDLPKGAPTPFISSSRSEENPKFSPDGRRVAFRSDRSGHPEIWVCDSDGSDAVQLTAFGGPMVADVNWSPDGRHLVFKAAVYGHGDLYVIGAEGGTPQRLTTEPSDDLLPGWSQDGRWIYFASNRNGTDQIWKMPATGGAAVQITKEGGFYSQESPDGKFLYYGKDRNFESSLWRVPVTGGEEMRVLESIAWWMNFSVGNQGIYFMPAGMPPTIQLLRLTTGKIEPVATLGRRPAAGLTVSPDGRTLLCSVWEQEGADLMLVENFR